MVLPEQRYVSGTDQKAPDRGPSGVSLKGLSPAFGGGLAPSSYARLL